MVDSARTVQDASLKEARARLTTVWNVRGIDVATLQVDARGTIVPSPTSSVRPHAISDLPSIVTDPEASRVAELKLGEVLGEGGMGIVFAATQGALDRDVAVKSLRPDVRSAALTRQLLLEARITGALEHPNVVPIHTLGRDEQGQPLIVMKRIDGISWERLLSQQHAQGRDVVLRDLDRHLEVLIDVAKALHFAHARAVVHRDVKPGNVMIGSFGEIYVVDWGIAARCRADAAGAAPLATDGDAIIGSPAYMSPEMASGDVQLIDERTDVYLLGACLHEVLTGAPPHSGPNPMTMLAHAFESKPHDYDSAVPPGLGLICHIAMSPERDDRYPTAAAFAAALEEFRNHRSSMVLADEASAKLDELRQVLTLRDPTNVEAQRALYNLFNECRFGFANALRIWTSNTRAREQLQNALELMISYELRHGSAGAAAALVNELPIRRPKLAEKVETARTAEQSNELELARMRHAADPTAQDRSRATLAFVTSAFWALGHGLALATHHYTSFAIAHYELAGMYGLFFVGALALGIASRRTLFARRMAAGVHTQLTLILAYGGSMLAWLVARIIDLSSEQGFVLMFFVMLSIWSEGAINVDRRLLGWTVSLLFGLVLTLVWPAHALLWMGICGTVASAFLGILRWRTRSAEQASPLSQVWSEVPDTLHDSR